MAFYAEFNLRADMNNGDRGFANSWEVCRFRTRAARDDFVAEKAHKLAAAITRRQAEMVFASQYECEGRPVPRGGLFGRDDRQAAPSHFWNERQAE